MRPTRNNHFPYRSTLLTAFDRSASGFDVLFRIDLRAFLSFTPDHVNAFLNGTGLNDARLLAAAPNLPRHKLIALPTSQVAEFADLAPLSDLKKAVAVLAMTDLGGYGPGRPPVLSEVRLKRDLVYCIPHRCYEAD